jgi:hypothetical protein
MESIASHASVRRLASTTIIDALAANDPVALGANVNGKRSASANSLQSLAGPTVKRMRVASATLVEPTDADARIADGLKTEGWTDARPGPDAAEIARRAEARRQLRAAEARRKSAGGRKSVGRAPPAPLPLPPSKGFFGRAADGFRALGTDPKKAPTLAAAPAPALRRPASTTFGQHTAARAAVPESLRKAPSTALLRPQPSVASLSASTSTKPAVARKPFDLQASLSRGTKYKPKRASRVSRG